MDLNGQHYVNAIRTLHQTVVSLRSALQTSRDELVALKESAHPLESLENAITALSLENHLLRTKIVRADLARRSLAPPPPLPTIRHKASKKKRHSRISESVNVDLGGKKMAANKEEDDDSLHKNRGEGQPHMVLSHSPSAELIDQEVDNIELIFTNEDTKESNLKEPLISIVSGGALAPDEPVLSVDLSDREMDDDVFNDNFENENQENANFQSQTFDFTHENSEMYNSKSDNSINHEEMKSIKSFCSSFQDSSFENKSIEKDESFDRFEERVCYLETDISKVGIHEVIYADQGRRNTCPNPLQYRPMIHREVLRDINATRKTRPILQHSHPVRKESGAQTDISALPSKSSWRSESSLAAKVKLAVDLTTLPSKYYPIAPGCRLRPSEKTVEARRILLSDIGFTSMVPELSRSADHLYPINTKACSVQYGQFLKTTDLYSPGYSQNDIWSSTSPSCKRSQSQCASLCPFAGSPLATTRQIRRCSAPVSPSRKNTLRSTSTRVRFANSSLPELRTDWNDSGDSTDSLVEEAEQFLQQSIDCMLRGVVPKTNVRRASAPDPGRDVVPPQGWQPFLPRVARDLRLDYWVKVISPESRVRGGRVRYVGHLLHQSEQFVGVQLSTPDGHSDGVYNNRRYFQCEPNHGIFVPFRKVIMGWKP